MQNIRKMQKLQVSWKQRYKYHENKDPDKLKYKWSHHQSGPAWYINPDMQWNLIGPFDLQVYEVKCESEKLFGISK